MKADHHRIIERAIDHIRDRPLGRATLPEVAAAVGASPAHLDRVMKRRTGRAVGRHGLDVLLQRAALALRTTPRQIALIAFDCGYSNAESFSRAFRKMWKVSPRDYRRRHRLPQGVKHMTELKPEVALIKVPVTDFERSRRFYRDVLGLEEEFAVEQYGWAQYKAGPIPFCLYVVGRGGGDGVPGNELNVHLAVSDLGAASGLLKARGATIVCPLTPSSDGGSFLIVADPDNNRLKIVQRL